MSFISKLQKPKKSLHSLLYKNNKIDSHFLLLNWIIFGLVFLTLFIFLITVILGITNNCPVTICIYSFAAIPLYLFANHINKKGKNKFASYLTVFTLYLFLVLINIQLGNSPIIPLGYAAAVLISIMICGTLLAILFALSSPVIFYLSSLYEKSRQIYQPNSNDDLSLNLLGMTVILALIVLLSWFTQQVLKNILNHLRKRNNLLHQNNRALEDKIKKLKTEKISAHKQTRQLDILRHLTKEIIELKNLDELLTQITKSSIELLKGDAGGIYLYKPEKNILEWVVSIGA